MHLLELFSGTGVKQRGLFQGAFSEASLCGNQHLWPQDAALPYERRVCGLALTAPQRLAEPIPYWRPPGAVGVNIFRRTAEDAPPARPKGGGKKKRPGSTPPTQIDSQAMTGTDGEKAGSEAEAER